MNCHQKKHDSCLHEQIPEPVMRHLERYAGFLVSVNDSNDMEYMDILHEFLCEILKKIGLEDLWNLRSLKRVDRIIREHAKTARRNRYKDASGHCCMSIDLFGEKIFPDHLKNMPEEGKTGESQVQPSSSASEKASCENSLCKDKDKNNISFSSSRFKNALNRMQPRHRMICIMFMRGYSRKHIAEVLNIPTSTFYRTIWTNVCEEFKKYYLEENSAIQKSKKVNQSSSDSLDIIENTKNNEEKQP